MRRAKPLTTPAGVADSTPVQVTAEPSLEPMLQAFDPTRHGGEVMADGPMGAEVIR